MAGVTLAARPREGRKGEARKARRRGAIPAVLYGPGIANRLVEVGARDLRKALATEAGENVVISLLIEGAAGTEAVMVKEVQIDPVTHAPLHADLYRIDVTRKVRVQVPVELAGVSKGVQEGGILQQVLREIEVECLPTAIPSHFTVDVTELTIGKSIHVAEVAIGGGMEITPEAGATVIGVPAPRTGGAAPAAAGPLEPEFIGAKPVEGEEAAAEGEAKEGKAKDGKEAKEGKETKAEKKEK